jgi:ABC-type molybdenum transport system ATPase subunit/photorepair protein PhrA
LPIELQGTLQPGTAQAPREVLHPWRDVSSGASVALQKIEELGLSLATRSTEVCPLSRPEQEMTFEQLELKNVSHSYHHEKDDSHFVLGPMSLTFRPGELVFLIGGNGSGKSTLAKIVTGFTRRSPVRSASTATWSRTATGTIIGSSSPRFFPTSSCSRRCSV